MSRRSAILGVLLLSWSGACDPDDSEGPGGAEDAQVDTDDGETDDGETDDGGVGGELQTCASLDEVCRDGAVCDLWTCGGQPAQYNHGGCPRLSCDDDEACPSGEACYARAYGAACLPSDVSCTQGGDACECTPTDDCDGILQAHCLPVAVYAPATYCDLEAWSCSELPEWIGALQRAALEHEQAGSGALAEGLRSCAERALDAAAEC